MKANLFDYLVRLGDDSVVLGHRLAEWCSNAPLLEEDLALSNIALDHIGRALSIFEYAAELEGAGQTADQLVYLRDERHYHNHLLAEQPNGDFAHSMVRQFFFSAYDLLVATELSSCADERLAAIFQKAVKEVQYHRNHAANWLLRLGKGTTESHERSQAAVNVLWPYTGELFEMSDLDRSLLADGIGCDLHALHMIWDKDVRQILANANLEIPKNVYMHTGGTIGVHTEYLGHMLAEMQFLVRAHPTATW